MHDFCVLQELLFSEDSHLKSSLSVDSCGCQNQFPHLLTDS